MALLTVQNLAAGDTTFQDPSGETTYEISIAAGTTKGPVTVSLDVLSRLEPLLNQQQAAGNIIWTVTEDPQSQADQSPDSSRLVLVSPYNALPGDLDIQVNLTAPGPVSIVLSPTTLTGKRVTVYDGKGDGATNNITMSVGGGGTLRGNGVINTAYGAATFLKVSALIWQRIA